MTLAIRTDTAEATIALYQSGELADQTVWLAGRKLSNELLSKIEELLRDHQTDWQGLAGIIVFQGPGSFTGLRIGVTVANAASYSLGIPIVGTTGEDWAEKGLKLLSQAKPGQIVLPEYGAEANISKPKK